MRRTFQLLFGTLLLILFGASEASALLSQNHAGNEWTSTQKYRVMGYAEKAPGRLAFLPQLRLQLAMGCEGYGYENASGQGSYCNGDPVNGLDPDGRLGKGGLEAIGFSDKEATDFLDPNAWDAAASDLAGGYATLAMSPIRNLQASYDANYAYFGNTPDALSATLDPAYKAIAGGYEAYTGQGIQASDSGNTLSGWQRAGSAFEGIQGTVDTVGFALGAGAFVDSALAKSTFCFPPGTKVLMANGTTKAIENVLEGDKVASDDVNGTGKRIDKPVTQLHTNWTKRLIHILISSSGNGKVDGELQATGEHPIWTQNRGWVNAKDLIAGDRLLDPMGRAPRVVSAVSVPNITATYNLSIEGTHAFFVMAGKTPILVHNTDPVLQFEILPYGQFRNFPRDGLTGHELLQAAWLNQNGYGSRPFRNNPAMALPAEFHTQVINPAQGAAGLNNPENLASMSAEDNILMNAEVLRQSGVPEAAIQQHVEAALEYANNLPTPCP